MSINFDPNVNRLQTPIKNSGVVKKEAPSFSVADSVVHSTPEEQLPLKPAFNKVDISSSQEMKNIASPYEFANAVAASSVPGPASLPIADMLKKLEGAKVTFYRQRLFRIPYFMDKYKEINADEASQIMASGSKGQKDRLAAYTDGKVLVDKLKEDDVRDLIAYKDLDKTGTVGSRPAINFLKEVEKEGFYLQIRRSENKGSFKAIRHLQGRGTDETDKDKPVDVIRDGTSVMSIRQDEVGDLRNLQPQLKIFKDVYEQLNGSGLIVQEVLNSPDSAPLNQRVMIAKGIMQHCKGYYDSDQNKNTAKFLKQMQELSKDGGEFVKVGQLFVEALEAHGNEKYEDVYGDGLKLIGEKLKDSPADFLTFKTALKDGVDFAGAIKMFEMLKEPVKNGDYEAVTKAFSTHKDFSNPEKVGLVMEGPDDALLPVRISIAEDIFKHSSGYYSSEAWNNTMADYGKIKELAGNGKDFEKIGKMYCRMLDTIGSEKKQESYGPGLDLIAGKLKDRNEDFEVFIKAIKNGINPSGAVEMFQLLPEPVQNGDYEKATNVFTGKKLTDPEKVQFIMPDVGNSTLQDRSDIAEGIYRHSQGYYGSDQWKNTVNDYESIKTLAVNDDDFSKIGKMYVQMLDVNNSEKFTADYKVGLDLIAGKLKDKPEEFGIFLKLIENGATIPGAVKMFEMLPENAGADDSRKMADAFKGRKLQQAEHVELIAPPAGSSTLTERIDIAEGIYAHSKGYYGSDQWKNTVADYGNIKTLSKTDDDFVKIGKCYVQMLDATGSVDKRDDYKAGLEFIASTLKDKPYEFDVFIGLIKSGTSIEGAVKLYETLPEPGGKEMFAGAAGVFSGSKMKYAEQVETIMKSTGNSTVKDRHDIAVGIYEHSKGYYGSDQWKNTKTDFDYIKTLAKDDADFSKIGKCYVRMLEAYGSENKMDDYRSGLDFIASQLKDKPSEFDVFIGLIKSGISVNGAVKLYETLPKPVEKEMFAGVASVFSGSIMKYAEQVETIMEPAGNSTVKERHEIAQGIFEHSKGYYGSDQWKNAKNDYDYIKSVAKDGDDFTKIGKCYVRMLETIGSENHTDQYQTGLEAIAGGLKDKPDDFEVFIDLIKNGMSASGASKMYEMLPVPVQQGDYKKVAALFEKSELKCVGTVQLVMTPVENTTVSDRFTIANSIYKHSKGGYSSDRLQKTIDDFNFLKTRQTESGKGFTEIGLKYVRMLDARKSENRAGDFNTGLVFITDDLRDNPDGLESFLRLVNSSDNISGAIEAYKKIQTPVGSETYEEREKAAAKLIGTHFNEKYDITFRNVLPGEKPEDAAALAAAINVSYSFTAFERVENLLKEVQANKGPLNSSEPVKIIRTFGLGYDKKILDTLDVLKYSIQGEPYSQRENLFFARYEGLYKQYSNGYEEALKDFRAMSEGILKSESPEESLNRFDNFHKLLDGQAKPELIGTPDERRQAFVQISQSMRKGTFRGKSFDEILNMLGENLLVARSLNNAVEHLIYASGTPEEKKILREEEQVIIGGVKLTKRKR